MPRFEYRNLKPQPDAEKLFLEWIDSLDQQFADRDPDHRSLVVRDALHQLYLGRPYASPAASDSLAHQALVHSFDPRNVTLEPESYGDAAVVGVAVGELDVQPIDPIEKQFLGVGLRLEIAVLVTRHGFLASGSLFRIAQRTEGKGCGPSACPP